MLRLALERGGLEEKQFLGVAFASILAGGSSWAKLPELLKNNADKVTLLQNLQGPLEEVGLPKDIAHWIINNCPQVTV